MFDRFFCKLFPSPIFRDCLFELTVLHHQQQHQLDRHPTLRLSPATLIQQTKANELDHDLLPTIASLALRHERWTRAVIKGCVLTELKKSPTIESVFASRSAQANRLLRSIIEPVLLVDVLPLFKRVLSCEDFDQAKVVLHLFEGLSQIKWRPEVTYTARILARRTAVKPGPDDGNLAVLRVFLVNLLVPRLYSLLAECLPSKDHPSSRRFLRIIQLFKYAVEIGSDAGELFHVHYSHISANLQATDAAPWPTSADSSSDDPQPLQAKLLHFVFQHALAMGRQLRHAEGAKSKKLFASWVKLTDAVRQHFHSCDPTCADSHPSPQEFKLHLPREGPSSSQCLVRPTEDSELPKPTRTDGQENVEEWTCGDVTMWLEENNLEELKAVIQEEQVTGAQLMEVPRMTSILVSSCCDLVVMQAFFRAHRRLCCASGFGSGSWIVATSSNPTSTVTRAMHDTNQT